MILGIDLGTMYSVAAYVDDAGHPQIITNLNGEEKTPSVVLFEDEDSVVVGRTAKEHMYTRPNDIVTFVKKSMGTGVVFTPSNGKEYTPEVVSSFILKKIVSDAEKQLGTKITDVAVTVPATFNDVQRKATMDAVKIAGLNLCALIDEPVAAAYYYSEKCKISHANILTYDIGGGMFETAIINVKESAVTLKNKKGLADLGGSLWDEKIVEYIRQYIENKYDVDITDDVDYCLDLYSKVENAKIQLCDLKAVRVTIVIAEKGIRESITITRALLNKIIEKDIKRTKNRIKVLQEEADMEMEEFDRVILIGGSTKIPYIQDFVKDYTGKILSFEVNPDLVVAQGAALYANFLLKQKNEEKVERKVIHDVSSHGIGIKDYIDGKFVNDILIKANTKLPAEAESGFCTVNENQKVIEIWITEGDNSLITDVSIIAKVKFSLETEIKQKTKGIIRVKIDEFNIVHLFVEIPELNYKDEIVIKRETNFGAEDITEYSRVITKCEVN